MTINTVVLICTANSFFLYSKSTKAFTKYLLIVFCRELSAACVADGTYVFDYSNKTSDDDYYSQEVSFFQ